MDVRFRDDDVDACGLGEAQRDHRGPGARLRPTTDGEQLLGVAPDGSPIRPAK